MSDRQRELLAAAMQRLADRTAKVVVVGQGYVGLPVAMRAVEVGFPVVGFEASPDRVKALQGAQSYVGDVSNEVLERALAAGYLPTGDAADLAGFDVAVISVPTPLTEGQPDLSYIEVAGRQLAAHLRPGACVILESTTYPGTTEELLVPILVEGSGLAADEFFCGYSPERIDPGNEKWTLVNTPKVTSGVDEASLQVVDGFFDTLVDTTVPVATTAEAEMTKLLENTFRHVNIALVNELAMFAHELGVNVWNAIDAAATKPFGFMKFTPGPGVGGHCLPIDPAYLAWRVKTNLGRTFRFVELANDINNHMPEYVVQRIVRLLNDHKKCVNGSKILLLGLAYKKGTSDWRESPSIPIAEMLTELGAKVAFCDPYVSPVNVERLKWPLIGLTDTESMHADLVALLVDHPEFASILDVAPRTILFDARHTLQDRLSTAEVL